MKKQVDLKGLNYYPPSFVNEKAAASDVARFMVEYNRDADTKMSHVGFLNPDVPGRYSLSQFRYSSSQVRRKNRSLP